MKKVFGLLVCAAIVLSMVLTPVCAAEEDPDLVYFDPSLASMNDMDIDDWMLDEPNRALLTVFMAIDLAIEVNTENVPVDLSKPTYIGRSGDVIDIYYHGVSGFDYLVVFNSGYGLAAYKTMEATEDILVKVVLSSVCDDGYYENDPTTLAEIAHAIAMATEQ